jgi:uncharacterized protein (TIGR02679 family)
VRHDVRVPDEAAAQPFTHLGVPNAEQYRRECCGDAHALDEGRAAGTLALSAARALSGLSLAAEVGADARRAAWAAVGVHLDELSSLVLCLGLPGDTRTALGKVLAAQREAEQPAVLTLRQLRCHGAALYAGPVRVCENPVVIAAAADELGRRCPPLVCVGGQPSAAVWRCSTCSAQAGLRSITTAISTGAASGSPVRSGSGQAWSAGGRGGSAGPPTKRQWR